MNKMLVSYFLNQAYPCQGIPNLAHPSLSIDLSCYFNCNRQIIEYFMAA